MLLRKSFRFLLIAVLAMAFPACQNFGKKKQGDSTGADGDYVSGSPLPERQEGVSFLSSNVDRSRFRPVYFGFDSYTVAGEERGKISQVAEFLRSGNATVILAGFTDERGTPEYNRGLGERRAQAVRQALMADGADPSKIQTVSFGSEMPADPGSGDSAWAKNRRAEFGVTR